MAGRPGAVPDERVLGPWATQQQRIWPKRDAAQVVAPFGGALQQPDELEVLQPPRPEGGSRRVDRHPGALDREARPASGPLGRGHDRIGSRGCWTFSTRSPGPTLAP